MRIGTFFALEMRNTPGKGRGLFAGEAIPANALIQLAPTVEVSPEDRELIDDTHLYNFYFHLDDGEREEYGAAVVLGSITLCNHSTTPNAKLAFDDSDCGIIVKLIAAADIAPGEEITVQYGDEALWFDYQE